MNESKQLAKANTMRVLRLTEQEYDNFQSLGEKLSTYSALTLDEQLAENKSEFSREDLKEATLTCIELFAITGDKKVNLLAVVLDTICLSLIKKSEQQSSNEKDTNHHP